MNTNTQKCSCSVHKNHSHGLFTAIKASFATIGSDTMQIMQDKIPVADQSTQPKQWTKQQLQQSVTNRHVICDAMLHGHLLHRISPTMTTVALLISNLHGNANEPYGRVVHPANDDMRKANPDDDRLDSTNGRLVVASSSDGGDDDDDEDDPYKRKLHNNGCGGDESPTDRNENDQDNDQDHDNENGFTGEVVDGFGSVNPDDFPNVDFDDDMEIDEDDMVEVGVVDEIEEEDLVGLWEE